jgi:hypothetical protein
VSANGMALGNVTDLTLKTARTFAKASCGLSPILEKVVMLLASGALVMRPC